MATSEPDKGSSISNAVGALFQLVDCLRKPNFSKRKNKMNKQKKKDINKMRAIDPISYLNRTQQVKRERPPQYAVIAISGIPYREYTVQCTVGGLYTVGRGPDRKIAKRNSAEAMLDCMDCSRPEATSTQSAYQPIPIEEPKADLQLGQDFNPITCLNLTQQMHKPVFACVGKRGEFPHLDVTMRCVLGNMFTEGSGPDVNTAKLSAAEAMLQHVGCYGTATTETQTSNYPEEIEDSDIYEVSLGSEKEEITGDADGWQLMGEDIDDIFMVPRPEHSSRVAQSGKKRKKEEENDPVTAAKKRTRLEVDSRMHQAETDSVYVPDPTNGNEKIEDRANKLASNRTKDDSKVPEKDLVIIGENVGLLQTARTDKDSTDLGEIMEMLQTVRMEKGSRGRDGDLVVLDGIMEAIENARRKEHLQSPDQDPVIVGENVGLPQTVRMAKDSSLDEDPVIFGENVGLPQTVRMAKDYSLDEDPVIFGENVGLLQTVRMAKYYSFDDDPVIVGDNVKVHKTAQMEEDSTDIVILDEIVELLPTARTKEDFMELDEDPVIVGEKVGLLQAARMEKETPDPYEGLVVLGEIIGLLKTAVGFLKTARSGKDSSLDEDPVIVGDNVKVHKAAQMEEDSTDIVILDEIVELLPSSRMGEDSIDPVIVGENASVIQPVLTEVGSKNSDEDPVIVGEKVGLLQNVRMEKETPDSYEGLVVLGDIIGLLKTAVGFLKTVRSGKDSSLDEDPVIVGDNVKVHEAAQMEEDSIDPLIVGENARVIQTVLTEVGSKDSEEDPVIVGENAGLLQTSRIGEVSKDPNRDLVIVGDNIGVILSVQKEKDSKVLDENLDIVDENVAVLRIARTENGSTDPDGDLFMVSQKVGVLQTAPMEEESAESQAFREKPRIDRKDGNEMCKMSFDELDAKTIDELKPEGKAVGEQSNEVFFFEMGECLGKQMKEDTGIMKDGENLGEQLAERMEKNLVEDVVNGAENVGVQMVARVDEDGLGGKPSRDLLEKVVENKVEKMNFDELYPKNTSDLKLRWKADGEQSDEVFFPEAGERLAKRMNEYQDKGVINEDENVGEQLAERMEKDLGVEVVNASENVGVQMAARVHEDGLGEKPSSDLLEKTVENKLEMINFDGRDQKTISDLELKRKAGGLQSDAVFFPAAGKRLAKRMKEGHEKGVINEGENVGEQLAERIEKDLCEEVVNAAENVGVQMAARVDENGLGDKPSSDLIENVGDSKKEDMSFGELDAKTTADQKLRRKTDCEQSYSAFFPEAGERLAKRMKEDQDKGVINEGENVGEKLAERMEKDLCEEVVNAAENVGVQMAARVDEDGLGDKTSSDLLENMNFGELHAKTTADLRLKRKADGDQSDAVFFSEAGESLAKRIKEDQDEGVINEGENEGELLAERMGNDLVEDVVNGAENVGLQIAIRADEDGLGDKPSSDLLENMSFGELDAKTTADLRLTRKADGDQSGEIFTQAPDISSSHSVESKEKGEDRVQETEAGQRDQQVRSELCSEIESDQQASEKVTNQNIKEVGMLTGFRNCISTIFRIPFRTQEGQHRPGRLQELD